ncbi:type II toxin-antitoxin system VapC family toxin [Ferrovibrio xuzhouensis]|uniref:Type II toxin-antitoxin system VapC family toxin n=1 Tax=Ferrovibrio xuzhouensis TaxID=1576914 RepID=A0ABV7VH68_9PROT
MRLLLDTNAFLWALDDLDRLLPDARTALRSSDNDLFVSMASLWEIAIKVGTGKLTAGLDWESYLPRMGATLLGIEPAHARAVADLPLLHRDPFDRMLVAQARIEDLILVTHDRQLADYDITVLPA